MKKPVTVSLVVPIYGVERYIGKFAESAFGQSYPHIQYIFVNDGTKDNSINILKEVLEKYPARKEQVVIVDKENGGLPAARRTGLEYVTGEYVYHVDSDDWLSETAIEKIAARIEETGSDIIYFNFVKEYEGRSKCKRERLYTVETKAQYIRNMFNHKSYAAVWNKCVKATLYKEHEIYVPQFGYAEDCYLTSQLVGYAGSISFLDEELYHYRKGNPNALTRQGIKKRKREYAMNFIDLYEKYSVVPREANPVAPILDDIAMQLAWYSILYNLGLFREYPYLAKAAGKAKLSTGTNVPLPAQLLVKAYLFFKR